MKLKDLHWSRIRFWLGLLLITCVVVGLVLHALKSNINAYVTPSGLMASEQKNQSMRLGGLVKEYSVVYDQNHLVHFSVTDGKEDVHVVFDGVLPALFEEGKGVVAQGNFDDHNQVFMASQVLAKHDENYQPPMPS